MDQLRELHLFAGAGGGILGGLLLGHLPVCAVEIDPYCQQLLLKHQHAGRLPRFPIWDDVCTFDGVPWRGRVDVVCGGFPCQDISAAGKGAGFSGSRSGLWREYARILGEIRPRYAFIENSPMLTLRGLDVVLSDLAALGMDAVWCCLGVDDIGAPHLRKRLWILANANSPRLAQWSGQRDDSCEEQSPTERAGWWESEPNVGRVAHGVAHRVDRLKALGNGQVPACAALAWDILIHEACCALSHS